MEIIKDRVQEIKQDVDWKEKVTQEWNDAAAADEENIGDLVRQQKRQQDDD